MPRRRWLLSLLVAPVFGASLIGARPSQAAVHAYPGVRDLVRRADGGYPVGFTDAHSVTPDGRLVLLVSRADGLVADDANGTADVFVADTSTGAVDRISDADGGGGASMSPDARWVVWHAPAGWRLTDRTNDTTASVPVPDGGAVYGISDQGDALLFGVPRPTMPPAPTDWYVYSPSSGQSVLVDVDPSGQPVRSGASAARLSGDGETVVFDTSDPAFDPRLDGATTGVVRWRRGRATELLMTGPSLRVSSVDTSGEVVAASTSGPGGSGGLLRTSTGVSDLGGWPASTTPDGRYVLLVTPDRQLHRLDIGSGERALVGADQDGGPIQGGVLGASISADGGAVAFFSAADGVVAGVPHGAHTYVRDVDRGTTALVCCDLSSPARTSDQPLVANGGDRVVFTSLQPLDPDDTGNEPESFVWDRPAGGFHAGTGRGSESSGSMGVPVVLDEVSTQVTHLTWQAVGTWSPSDVGASSGALDIPAGVRQGTIQIPVVDDDVHEGTEQLSLRVTNSIGPQAIGTVIVEDDDAAPAMAVADSRVAENHGPMVWTITLDHASALPSTVAWAVAEDAGAPATNRATSGRDFTPGSGTATFAPGQTTLTVIAAVLDDLLPERPERFTLLLSAPTGAVLLRSTATGTIDDDEAAVLPPSLRDPIGF